MCGISACMQRNTPVRLIASVRSQFARAQSSSGAGSPSMPALLNAWSNRPKRSTVVETMASTESASATSVGTNSAVPPSEPIEATTSCPLASSVSATTTLAP